MRVYLFSGIFANLHMRHDMVLHQMIPLIPSLHPLPPLGRGHACNGMRNACLCLGRYMQSGWGGEEEWVLASGMGVGGEAVTMRGRCVSGPLG